MDPFALSIPGYRLGIHPNKTKQQQQHQQRYDEYGNTTHLADTGESRSPTPDFSQRSSSRPGSQSRSQSHIINPLSHSPDTLRQLALAGLAPEDELPSVHHPGFPHRPLPSATKKRHGSRKRHISQARSPSHDQDGHGRGIGGDAGASSYGGVAVSSSAARIRHLNTLTAIMHRCLRDGDIPRAKRAMGLLMRTRDVDVRLDNLWVIGSEILMRDGEVPPASIPSSISTKSGSVSASPSALGGLAPSQPEKGSLPSYSYGVSQDRQRGDEYNNNNNNNDDEHDDEDGGRTRRPRPPPPQRWGTAANFPAVKTYLELLIHHHPYDRHRPNLTSAVDFWPALFGIEVYNLDVEFRRAVHHVELEYPPPPQAYSSPSPSRSPSPSPSFGAADRMDIDEEEEDSFTREEKKYRRSRRRRREEEVEDEEAREKHARLDALRTETQRAALELSARMDGVLENAPSSSSSSTASHAEILRLRGHVSLFVADLHLPSRLVERYHLHLQLQRDGDGDGVEERERERERRSSSLRDMARTPDERVALARRRDEQQKARRFFRRVLALSSPSPHHHYHSSADSTSSRAHNTHNPTAGSRGGAGARLLLEDWVLRFLDEEEDED